MQACTRLCIAGKWDMSAIVNMGAMFKAQTTRAPGTCVHVCMCTRHPVVYKHTLAYIMHYRACTLVHDSFGGTSNFVVRARALGYGAT